MKKFFVAIFFFVVFLIETVIAVVIGFVVSVIFFLKFLVRKIKNIFKKNTKEFLDILEYEDDSVSASEAERPYVVEKEKTS